MSDKIRINVSKVKKKSSSGIDPQVIRIYFYLMFFHCLKPALTVFVRTNSFTGVVCTEKNADIVLHSKEQYHATKLSLTLSGQHKGMAH